MKNQVLIYSVLLNLLLFVVVILSAKEAGRARTSYSRVLRASETLNKQYQTIETDNGQLVGQNQVLQLRNQELEKLVPELQEQIQFLQVRPSRVESLSSTAFTAETRIQTALRDSTVFDTVAVKQFKYADEFYRIEGFAISDTQHLNITYQDTLIQTVYRGKRKKPWLWIFSPRQLEQRVALKNPNATINYSQHIQILQ